MGDGLLENPLALARSVARVLHGVSVQSPDLTGFVNSDFDSFLNHLFVGPDASPGEGLVPLDGRPGFVWLASVPTLEEEHRLRKGGVLVTAMHGMTATIAECGPPQKSYEVRSRADFSAWHEVYCDGLEVDGRSRQDWQLVYDALGPEGEGTLLLLLARVGQLPAAAAAVFFEDGQAGLYCFTTRVAMRGKGLASVLVHASHAAARARGIDAALLQATEMGRPVYARAGYREQRLLPVLIASHGASRSGSKGE